MDEQELDKIILDENIQPEIKMELLEHKANQELEQGKGCLMILTGTILLAGALYFYNKYLDLQKSQPIIEMKEYNK